MKVGDIDIEESWDIVIDKRWDIIVDVSWDIVVPLRLLLLNIVICTAKQPIIVLGQLYLPTYLHT